MANFCEYCGAALGADDKFCTSCGAPVSAAGDGSAEPASGGRGIPQSIEELKVFCLSHRMPLEQMRFFIGEDYPGPRAFGIFQDTDGCFVVYKNKADGSRAVRYRGPDEAYAVREIYLKLKEETAQRRSGGRGASRSAGTKSSGGSMNSWIELLKKPAVWVLILFAAFSLYRRLDRSPNRGYYQYDDSYYYYQNDSWYTYDDSTLNWILLDSVDRELERNYGDYYESSYYDSDYAVSDFSDTSYYTEPADDDWDSDDWDYDYDSWDSGDTDWDSDW